MTVKVFKCDFIVVYIGPILFNERLLSFFEYGVLFQGVSDKSAVVNSQEANAFCEDCPFVDL